MAKTVLNLQAMRAERSASAPVIVDQNGQEHPVGGVPLDLFLSMIELQQQYATGEGGASLEMVGEMVRQSRRVIEEAMPGFPVAGLTFDELMMVVDAMQSTIGPAAGPEAGQTSGEGDENRGELTPP